MAARYCSVTDVTDRATAFAGKLGQQGQPTVANVEAIIDEVMVEVDQMLIPRYLKAAIASYDPDYPPAIRYATAILAAMRFLKRRGSTGFDHFSAISKGFSDELNSWTDIITNGRLVDTTGAIVPRTTFSPVTRQTPPPPLSDEIGALYANQPRRY